MYIHIGHRVTVSGRSIIGIFNVETLRRSEENRYFLSDIRPEHRSIVIDRKNGKIASDMSPFTIIKRSVKNAFDRE